MLTLKAAGYVDVEAGEIVRPGIVKVDGKEEKHKKVEAGSDAEIADFCKAKYDVKFDMFSKVDVNGADSAPLFKHLTSEKAGVKDVGPVKWNFEKFVVGKDGKVVGRAELRVGARAEEREIIGVE